MKCKAWLLNWIKSQGKGGITPSGECEITENGEYDVAEYATADVNVPQGADLSEYIYNKVFGTSNGQGWNYPNYAIKKLPEGLEVYPDTTTLQSAFAWMRNLVTATYIDTSTIRNMRSMFNSCSNLENVPVYDTSNLSTDGTKAMEGMFTSCNKLTDESLDNILVMCINAPANMAGRNLGVLGLTASYYPVSRIEALPHYAEFRASNWSIGY